LKSCCDAGGIPSMQKALPTVLVSKAFPMKVERKGVEPSTSALRTQKSDVTPYFSVVLQPFSAVLPDERLQKRLQTIGRCDRKGCSLFRATLKPLHRVSDHGQELRFDVEPKAKTVVRQIQSEATLQESKAIGASTRQVDKRTQLRRRPCMVDDKEDGT
jgi:hypothetical protein